VACFYDKGPKILRHSRLGTTHYVSRRADLALLICVSGAQAHLAGGRWTHILQTTSQAPFPTKEEKKKLDALPELQPLLCKTVFLSLLVLLLSPGLARYQKKPR